MKKFFTCSVFFIACLYFLSAGSLCLFSKIGKNVQTELYDVDEDTADPESKEGKDCKEDGCCEDILAEILHGILLPSGHQADDITFIDPSLFVHKHVLEKNSPPPRA